MFLEQRVSWKIDIYLHISIPLPVLLLRLNTVKIDS